MKKLGKKEVIGDILIPSSIFLDRKLSIYEVLVEYLREREHLNFKEISLLLGRDQRNVWTIYTRAKRKREKYEKR